MKKKSFLRNKYTLSVFIILACLAADVVIHRGMSRVMLPDFFSEKRSPQQFFMCNSSLEFAHKKWKKGVNSIQQMEELPSDAAGFELDVYYDSTKNTMLVYHDSSRYSTLTLTELLKIYDTRKLTASVWLDFKNLTSFNEIKSLEYISHLSQLYHLQNKIIVESAFPQYLQSFCARGFFTSYYIPYFNPYSISGQQLSYQLDSISRILNTYTVSALSGYYFQYPVMKKYFPRYPILTWSVNDAASVVTNTFNRKLLKDPHVKIVLFP